MQRFSQRKMSQFSRKALVDEIYQFKFHYKTREPVKKYLRKTYSLLTEAQQHCFMGRELHPQPGWNVRALFAGPCSSPGHAQHSSARAGSALPPHHPQTTNTQGSNLFRVTHRYYFSPRPKTDMVENLQRQACWNRNLSYWYVHIRLHNGSRHWNKHSSLFKHLCHCNTNGKEWLLTQYEPTFSLLVLRHLTHAALFTQWLNHLLFLYLQLQWVWWLCVCVFVCFCLCV